MNVWSIRRKKPADNADNADDNRSWPGVRITGIMPQSMRLLVRPIVVSTMAIAGQCNTLPPQQSRTRTPSDPAFGKFPIPSGVISASISGGMAMRMEDCFFDIAAFGTKTMLDVYSNFKKISHRPVNGCKEREGNHFALNEETRNVRLLN